MWTIIKFDKKGLSFLKKDFQSKLGSNFKIYIPKFFLHKYKNNKLIKKEFNLLGDYLFCYHKEFVKPQILSQLKYCRGLKYFLSGFIKSQNEIEKFVLKCKNSEDDSGYLSKNFHQLQISSKYKFMTGPFTEMIFEIINLQKNKIDIFMGNIKTSIKKKDFLFNPV
tara:strand:- start:109 stop:606 length:498 start_codon:yes stop_codon:yes gene_type:complete